MQWQAALSVLIVLLSDEEHLWDCRPSRHSLAGRTRVRCRLRACQALWNDANLARAGHVLVLQRTFIRFTDYFARSGGCSSSFRVERVERGKLSLVLDARKRLAPRTRQSHRRIIVATFAMIYGSHRLTTSGIWSGSGFGQWHGRVKRRSLS